MQQNLPGGFKRKYRFRGGTTDAEQKRFWIILAITIAVMIAVFYFWG
jgi:hypothetical protein